MGRRKRVAVAMSGGVDSSVAAALLAEAGFEVVGLTMLLFGPEGERDGPGGEGPRGGPASIADARAVSEKLGIPHHVADFRRSFERWIVRDFCETYAGGRTPNPCVRCNRLIKFGLLWRTAAGLGADYLATGHYARIERDRRGGFFHLKKGADRLKDQSYFLYELGQKELARTLMPLGDLTKAQVRKRARALGLPVADKDESQEICFIPGQDYVRLLETRNPQALAPGPMVDEGGRVLGAHGGIARYTIGQRRGLGIAAPEPLYVLAIDAGLNRITVGGADGLLRKRLVARDARWVSGSPPARPLVLRARIRSRHPESAARIIPLSPTQALVEFRRPQRALTPGQAVVFYAGDEVIGGGTIGSVAEATAIRRTPWRLSRAPR
jgi:tRNA-specific 2-thiouridylase